MPQDVNAGRISLILRDSARKNRNVPVDIYYPEGSDKVNFSLGQESGERLPVICFGHGYLISGVWYENIFKVIVPEGYIMIFPASESGLFPSHMTLAEDMVFALDEIIRLGSDRTFQLYGRIDTMKCLMGHSMGGGSLFLAANLSHEVRAAVALAPYDTKPSAVEAASGFNIPTLIFAGSNDCVTPPEKHQIPIYNSCASEDKTFLLIKGGTHCQMGVSHPKCNFGERISGCRNESISQTEQLGIIKKYLIPWLDFYLKGDRESGILFDSLIDEDEGIEYMQSRPLLRE